MTISFDSSKTLEQLENDFWGEPSYNSYLVKTCHELRKKPVRDFDVEDLRIMIGQNIGLKYLLPLASETLQKNILAEGNMYEGDLLTNVLKSKKEYWKINFNHWEAVIITFKANMDRLRQFDTVESIKNEWFQLFEVFKRYH